VTGAPTRQGTRQLGLWMATALVIGNQIGSGIFLLPAALAPYQGYAVASWVFSAGGTLLLAVTFARLARRIPHAGGPYVYARVGFGEFTGFFMGWGYWISCIATNAAIASASVSYVSAFWPVVGQRTGVAAAVTVGTIGVLTVLNASGVRNGGLMQLVTVVMKLVPLVLIGTLGLLYIQPGAFAFEPPAGETPIGAVNAAVTLTLFAFLGFESAGIPADNVVDPDRTIPRATVLGTVVTAVVYVASTVAVMGILSADVLTGSSAPFDDAGRAIWGGWAGALMGLGAIVSCVGCLNGWILVAGQIPMAMARDGLFPDLFARTRADGTPSTAVLISGGLAALLLVSSFTGTLVELYTKTVLLATLTAVVPYLFGAMTELRLALSQEGDTRGAVSGATGRLVVPFAAFLYAMWAIVGAGQETVYLGFILLLAGLPVYVWLRRRTPLPS